MSSITSLEHSSTIELSCDLISRKSVTPEDKGCQKLMCERLRALDFEIHELPFGEVLNFWAIRGEKGPLFAFLGHTDVVPSGPEKDWLYPPYEPTIADGLLYGRGAADMKGSLAAMITATEAFVKVQPNHDFRLAFLITSDEEGPAANGTTKVVDWLTDRGEKIDYCLVGEPSSSNSVGDVIKNGRRGSLGCELKVIGKQGHVAYPHLALNPIHELTRALAEISTQTWDNGNDFFPATSFQVSNISAGTGATNVIPGEANAIFNFRFSTETTDIVLKSRVEAILKKHCSNYETLWHLSGQPFLTSSGELVEAVQHAISQVCNIDTELSTAGGTSDGRFVAPTGAQVVELGPVNATIHKVNECVAVKDLDRLHQIYLEALMALNSSGHSKD